MRPWNWGLKYWNKDGSPKFYTEKGAFDEGFFTGRYIFVYNGLKEIGSNFNIRRGLFQIEDTASGATMGEWIMYEYLGGWVMNSQPFGGVGFDCNSYIDAFDNPKAKKIEPTIFRKFTSYIFLNKNTKKERVK